MRVIFESDVVAELAGPANFTGRVWRSDYVRPEHPDALSGSRFLYEPGARSFWHVHEHEQVIIAVSGLGLVAWEGLGAAHRLSPGDWWHVEPGVAHWHGATPSSPFAHLAVTAGGTTTWLQPVTDAQYGG